MLFGVSEHRVVFPAHRVVRASHHVVRHIVLSAPRTMLPTSSAFVLPSSTMACRPAPRPLQQHDAGGTAGFPQRLLALRVERSLALDRHVVHDPLRGATDPTTHFEEPPPPLARRPSSPLSMTQSPTFFFGYYTILYYWYYIIL